MHPRTSLAVLAALSALSTSASALQADWARQSPLPYAPQLNPDEIAFSGSRGYLVGSNARLHETTDGGVTWHERVLTGPVLNAENYGGVAFSGPTHGWLVGDNLSWTNSCFRTVDGGVTWTPMDILPGSSWSHVDFVSTTRGWVGAWGNLYVTSDGGTSWSPQSFGVVDRIDSLNFFDANVGVLSAAGSLHRTQDGGQSWTVVHGHEAFAIEWLDATTVIASTVSSGGPDLARSTDAGLTWQTIQVPGVDLQEPVRVDALTAIAGTQHGDLYRSTDAGLTWNRVWDSGTTGSMNGGCFTSPTDGFVVESGNLILRTRDGGQTWSYVSNGMGAEFEDVKMFDAQRGLVAGAAVLRTDDGGHSWIPTTPASSYAAGNVRDLALVAPSFAFASGSTGLLLKSADAGLTWQSVPPPAGYPNGSTGTYTACSFISPTEGWIAGSYLEITHTLDGGNTWQQQFVGGSSADGVYDMDFVDAQHGWVVGTFGSGVLRTADGGTSWSFHAFPSPSPDGRAIDFVTPLVGWAASTGGFIARSTNGGLTWTRQALPVVGYNTHLDSIHALSVNECWAASTDNGRVFHTTNAGANWTELATPFHDDYDGYTGIAATASGEVWVAGYRGAVSRFGVPTTAAATTFCFGDGALTDHTAACPCGNTGVTGNGCANSFNALGANLRASGETTTDDVALTAAGMPATSFALFLQHDAAGDSVFHDGVICASGGLIRLRGRAAVAGTASFPSSSDTLTLSQRGGVFAGQGVRRYYAAWYRNAASSFCPPGTANVSNGLRIEW